jgi:hypothetical protein
LLLSHPTTGNAGCCARRERPCRRRAAECGQQFPSSDGGCHVPLRARCVNGTIPRHERAVFHRAGDIACGHVWPRAGMGCRCVFLHRTGLPAQILKSGCSTMVHRVDLKIAWPPPAGMPWSSTRCQLGDLGPECHERSIVRRHRVVVEGAGCRSDTFASRSSPPVSLRH